MKLKFGFVKVRYRGLKKNAHQLFVICGLVNLFISRKKLLLGGLASVSRKGGEPAALSAFSVTEIAQGEPA